MRKPMKNLKLSSLLLSAALIVSPSVYAAGCTQTNNTVGMVGLDGSGGTVFTTVSDHNNGCGCGFFRFTTTHTDTKMAMSVLLSAKVSGKKVRIDTIDDTNCATAYRVYLL